jgi:hypothetical protein
MMNNIIAPKVIKVKVKTNEWTLFVSMLTIVFVMYFTDIVDHVASFFLIVTFGSVMLFKNHLIGDCTRVCFDTKADFSAHENFIESLNKKRWGSLYFLVIAVMFFRILDMTGRIKFGSSLLMILLMAGLAIVFRKEIAEYIDYFLGRKSLKSFEESEMEILTSIYNSRMIFAIVISGLSMMYMSSIGMMDALQAFFALIFIIGGILYSYRYSFDRALDNFSKHIFMDTPYDSGSYYTACKFTPPHRQTGCNHQQN